ncbi:hypothetical protein BDQ17DRAFT_997657 [Cyathus striatus]|nr:hypothetical protein BDQ17DRAFT_997657 [Cyathus striatus]
MWRGMCSVFFVTFGVRWRYAFGSALGSTRRPTSLCTCFSWSANFLCWCCTLYSWLQLKPFSTQIHAYVYISPRILHRQSFSF